MGSSVDGDASVFSSGKLAYGCSNLATAWPHGGTGLGLVGQVFLYPQKKWAGLIQEETNSESEVLWLGGSLVVGLTLEGWDEDAMAVLHPNTATSSSRTIVEWPGTDVPPGGPITPLSNVVFTPRDTTNGKGWVIYKAAAVPNLNSEFAFNAGKFLEIPAVLVAIPDGSERLGKFGKFSDLSL